MDALLFVLVLTAALFLLQEVLRRAGPWVATGLYLVLPVALTPYWLRVNDFDPFLWIKIYTILFCACYGTALRFTSLGTRTWARGAVTLLLALNILEAVALDLTGGNLAHLLNAAAGLALVAALPRSADAPRLVASGCRREVHYDGISARWTVGYAVWNWTLVYLNYPEFAGHHAGVLACVLLVAALDPRRWLQARGYTLGAYFIVMATFRPVLLDWLDTSSWSDPRVGLGAAVISVLVATGCVWQSRAAAAAPHLCCVRGSRRQHSRLLLTLRSPAS